MSNATMAFDILGYAKKLKQVGFTEEQANVQAEAFSEITYEQLATKRDIKDLKSDMHLQFANFQSKIEKMEMRMIFKLASINVIVIGLFTGLLGILIK